MVRYERLFEEARNSRRTIADALDLLRDARGFKDSDQANIRIELLKLPSGDVVGLVNLFFEIPSGEEVCIVSLPTSAEFLGKRSGSPKGDRFDIARLDGAVADGRGDVRLNDGTTLRAVEVMPVYMPNEPSELDWRIVQHTISIIGAEERCYRRLGAELPDPYREMAPDIRFLDCSRLSELKLPPLKEIAWKIAARDPTLEKLSQQKIADALRRFGMRLPPPRPRVKTRSIATI